MQLNLNLVCSVHFKTISYITIITTITNSNTFYEIQSSIVCMVQHRCKSVVCKTAYDNKKKKILWPVVKLIDYNKATD
jgi:hypothetical protein